MHFLIITQIDLSNFITEPLLSFQNANTLTWHIKLLVFPSVIRSCCLFSCFFFNLSVVLAFDVDQFLAKILSFLFCFLFCWKSKNDMASGQIDISHMILQSLLKASIKEALRHQNARKNISFAHVIHAKYRVLKSMWPWKMCTFYCPNWDVQSLQDISKICEQHFVQHWFANALCSRWMCSLDFNCNFRIFFILNTKKNIFFII